MTQSPQDRARGLIERNTLMTLATSDEDGRPWVSPVFYSHDDDHRLYWVSDADSRHSANIRRNGTVAVVIHDAVGGRVDAVYMTAEVEELQIESDVRVGMGVMARRDQPEKWQITHPSEVEAEGPWRIYRARRVTTEVRRESIRQSKTVVGRERADF